MLDIDKILEILKKGEVILLPSDTVYGLFCDALNVKAIKKIDIIKNSNKPHLILVSNVNMIKPYVKEMSSLHKRIINRYWPGPLTILFKKSNLIPNELTKDSEYVGIRFPNHELLLNLINSYNKPLLSTSANISNDEVINSVESLDKRIKSKVSYIYDGGLLNNLASTIIKIENNRIIFIREGVISKQIKKEFNEYL